MRNPSLCRLAQLIMATALFGWSVVVTGATTSTVHINGAWARATPPNASVGAVFMTLHAVKADRLLGASTAAAQRVEMHSMLEQDGKVQMRPLPSLPLPQGKAVELSPTGTHLMLIGLRQPLRADTRVELTLRFEQAGEQKVQVRVLSPSAANPAQQGQHSHHEQHAH